MKIYTRKGDDGSTALWYGGRVSKSHPRTEAYGALDEANAALGMARAACADKGLAADILRLQRELFVVGAELATAPEARDRLEMGVSRLGSESIRWAEQRIDHYMAQVELPPKFVIPGGTDLSARLDLARTLLRHAERRIVDLQKAGELPESEVEPFVNRASDLAFAMARFADEPAPALFEGRGERSSETEEASE